MKCARWLAQAPESSILERNLAYLRKQGVYEEEPETYFDNAAPGHEAVFSANPRLLVPFFSRAVPRLIPVPAGAAEKHTTRITGETSKAPATTSEN